MIDVMEILSDSAKPISPVPESSTSEKGLPEVAENEHSVEQKDYCNCIQPKPMLDDASTYCLDCSRFFKKV